MEAPFDYVECYIPPCGGFPRYASAVLTRSPDRRFWYSEQHDYYWVMDDFGYLQFVGPELKGNQE